MESSNTPDTAAARQQISETNRRFEDAMNRQDAAGAAQAVYTKDACILPPGAAIVRGRDAIARFWTQAAAQMGVRSVQLSTEQLDISGDHAHEIGRATLSAGGGEATAKYVVIWKKEDGQWKWHVDIWNMNE
jgi:ketosteroid isomerase-like protein